MSTPLPPPPLGPKWNTWGERLNTWLTTTRDKLRYLVGGESASEDGILMWDSSDKNPVVSIDSVWTPLGLGGGTNNGSNAFFYDTTSQTASAVDTPYGVSWNSTAFSNNISINSGDSTRIDFAKGGRFYISFHATVSSSSASTKTLYFFPRVNGSDISSSTIVTTIHENGQKKVMSRNGCFEVSAGDYLQAMWATDDLNAWLENSSATSFAPSTPSVTMTIVEITT